MDALGDAVQFFGCGFAEVVVGRFAVDGVYHDLAGRNAFQGFEPRAHVFLARIVHTHAAACALHKQGLDDDVAVVGLQGLDDLIHIVLARGCIDALDVVGIYGVEFQDIVVHAQEGFAHLGAVGQGGVAQHADFRCGTQCIAQGDGVVDDAREVGVGRRFAVACKGEDVGHLAFVLHLAQAFLEGRAHHFARGPWVMRTAVGVESTFAVDAVEGTHLAIIGHEVDAQ